MTHVIDSHCHVYPHRIAQKAVEGIGAFYSIPMAQDGTPETLLSLMDEGGVSHAVISSCATKPSQVESINRFIAETVAQGGGRFTGLGTLHPLSEDIQADFDLLVSLGLHGVKLHPDIQRFAVDDPRCMPIYELCSGRMPVLVHTGDKRYDYSNPNRVAHVLEQFPSLCVVGAHLGGWSIWQEAAQQLHGYDNLVVDCSSSLYALPQQQAKELILRYGSSRVLFGSDYPMWVPGKELEALHALDLRQTDMAQILHDNACRVYGIEGV